MLIGAYLLDLISESQYAEFNIVLFANNCSYEVRLIEQMFPCCNFYSAEMVDDIEQLIDMHIVFNYIVITDLIDSEEKWDASIRVLPLLGDNGQIIVACPNCNRIDKIGNILKFRSMYSGYSEEKIRELLLMDIADFITKQGLLICKFGLFGDPLDSEMTIDELVKLVGEDYADSINACFLPYIRLSLKKPCFEKNDIEIKSNFTYDFIKSVNTYNMFNLVIRKKHQDWDFYMKKLDPVNKAISFDETANEVLKKKIVEGKPFCALRLGNTEGILIDNYINNLLEGQKKYSDFAVNYAFNTGGFFVSEDTLPETIPDYFDKFVRLQLEGFKNVDVMMMWGACRMEAVIANQFAPSSCDNISYFSLIPFVKDYEPWTAALAGKKVLVITNVPDSIMYQYSKKDLISPYKNSILPDFTLITYRMLQTCQQDNQGYNSWFEALDRVKSEICAMDFDIAIVGAGFYGVPLCDAIKKSGRSAIEMCGLTSFIFGVAGKRFVEDEKDFYGRYMTDSWIRPFDDKPEWFSQVEGGCYW